MISIWRAAKARGALALTGALLAGCAALPWPARPLPPTPGARDAEGWLDLRGIVHVHTRGSHDSPGRLADVIRAARRRGAAWVAITEHRWLGLHPGVRERDGVLVLPGFEIRAAKGSILAIGCPLLPPPRLHPPDIVRFVHDAGGVAFVGHLEKSRLADPAAFAAAGPDGVEIVNLHARANRARARTALRMLLLPRSLAWRAFARGPEPNLARYAALPQARAVVGGADAHAKIRLLGGIAGQFDPYEASFGLVTTHVLARDRSERAILDALRAGRSYVALEGRAPVPHFHFAHAPGGFVVETPRAARLVLSCDGGPATSVEAARAVLAPPPGARACHAEAWLGRDLWIVSSRLSVAVATPPAGPADARSEGEP